MSGTTIAAVHAAVFVVVAIVGFCEIVRARYFIAAIVAVLLATALPTTAKADFTIDYVGNSFDVSECPNDYPSNCVNPSSANIIFTISFSGDIPPAFTGSIGNTPGVQANGISYIDGSISGSGYTFQLPLQNSALPSSQQQPSYVSVSFVNGKITYWTVEGRNNQYTSSGFCGGATSYIASFNNVANSGTFDSIYYYLSCNDSTSPPIGTLLSGTDFNPGTISISGVTSPPTASNEKATTPANTAVAIDLTAGASGGPTSAALVGTPLGGTVSIKGTTATFTPTASCNTATPCSFQFTLSNAAGQVSNTAIATITTPPHIMFNGVDVTKYPLKAVAVVGQPISLSVDQPTTPTKPLAWQVPGSTIRSYVVSPECPTQILDPAPQIPPPCTGVVTPTDATDWANAKTSFYWIAPVTKQVVSYSYTLSDGTPAAPVSVTFTVEGPTNPTLVNPQLGHPVLELDKKHEGGMLLEFGGIRAAHVLGNNVGILLPPAATPPADYSGRFSWAQLLLTNTRISPFSKSGKLYTLTCSLPVGLDNTYPDKDILTDGKTAYDRPQIGLASVDTAASWLFQAQTYLLWRADTNKVPGAIPVPLGYEFWSFQINAAKDKTTHAWSAVYKASGQFIPNLSYPQWQVVDINGQTFDVSGHKICNETLK